MSALSDIKHEAQPRVLYLIKHELRVTSVLNSFKNDSFYTHLVTLFTKELLMQMLYKPRKSKQKFCENLRAFYHI